jgi:hypothetical protein
MMREEGAKERGWVGESVDAILDSGYLISLIMVPAHSPSKRKRPPIAQALDACRG